MARVVRDARIDTKNARAKLRQQSEPYWRLIAGGQHLGYYRGKLGGTWVARWRPSKDDLDGSGIASRGYHKTTIGPADDVLDADGVRVLSFAQAQEKARAWFQQKAREVLGIEEAATKPYTVADACRDYLAWLQVHRKSADSAEYGIKAHIKPKLGGRRLDRITPKDVRDWHEGLAALSPRLRTKDGKEQRYRTPAKDDHDAKRRRQATANRVLTILKAALNRAWHEGKVRSDEAWRRVKPFRGVDHPRVRYLTDAELVRLVNACAPDFRPMVQGALLTGARYGELCRVRVSDFDERAGRLTIREAKGGKPRHVVLTDEGTTFFHQQATGKASDALLLPRPEGSAWGHAHQQRPLLTACRAARIKPAASFHVLRHTYASRLAMRGVPLHVIAENLGHADTRMTARHYAHLAPSYVADVIRGAAPALGIVPQAGNVATLRPAAVEAAGHGS